MYYVLECFSSLMQNSAAISECPEIEGVESWLTGSIINTNIAQPIKLELDPNSPGEMLEMYQLEMTIMSDRLINTLIEFGVNNLQVYDAIISDPNTGTEFRNYKVVNVIGIISCADLSKSIFKSSGSIPLIDVDFESLQIDELRTHGLQIFRLAECISAIIIDENVKNFLLEKGFENLTFKDPIEFIG